MSNFTQGDTRVVLQQNDIATYQAKGSAVLDSRRTRPLWFDGRFLAARDLEREQNYFLQRQADLGRAPGFGILSGLLVSAASISGQTTDVVTISSGHGITPAGEEVSSPADVTIHLSALALQPDLDLQFGIATEPGPAPANRTGLFAIALQPMQSTGTPIAEFPTTIQGTRGSHDGDIIEGTAIILIPYPDPINTSDPNNKQAALARQIFLSGNASQLPDSVLPLALLSLQNGLIQWVDTYMLRRENGVAFSGVRFGLTDRATQQAYLQQYDSQLQTVVNGYLNQNTPANFSATEHFQSLPPAGRFPLACINTDAFTQSFFPPQVDVRLSVFPEDEIPALLEDSESLPPIDLTLDAAALEDITVFALIPVPRDGFAALLSSLPEVPMIATIPQILGHRQPFELLRFFQGASAIAPATPAANSSWSATIAAQTYGFYIRRRSSGAAVSFASPAPPVTTTTVPPPTTTAPPTTTTTPPPPTTTTPAPTTTVAPTTTTTTTLPPTTTTPQTTITFTIRPTTTRITTFTLFPPGSTLPFTIRPPFTVNPILTTVPVTLRPPFTIRPFALKESEHDTKPARGKKSKAKVTTKAKVKTKGKAKKSPKKSKPKD